MTLLTIALVCLNGLFVASFVLERNMRQYEAKKREVQASFWKEKARAYKKRLGSMRFSLEEKEMLILDLERQTTFDELTGAYTRAFLKKFLKEIGQYSLMFVDLDGFKQVNDNFGHDVGDEMLKKVAQSLKKSVRKFDIVSRFGGDEFIIVLPDAKKRDAEKLKPRVRNMVESIRIGSARVGASIGISEQNGCLDPLEVIKHADQLMYENKNKRKIIAG